MPLYTDAEKRQKFYLSLWNVGGWVGLSLATWHGLGRALGRAMVVGEWSDTVVDGHGCGERGSGAMILLSILLYSVSLWMRLDTSLVNNSQIVSSIPKTKCISRFSIL